MRPTASRISRWSVVTSAIPVRIHRPSEGRIVVQPEHRLPAERACRLAWSRAGRGESIGFTTFRASAAPGRSLYVLYRRANPGEIAPIPDDFWTVPDPGTATGLRLELPVALRSDVREVIEGLRSELSQADGWSPIGPIVIPISDRIEPSSIPRTVAESLDPTSTIALVDVDPESPGRGERFPFEAVLRRDRTSIGVEEHVALDPAGAAAAARWTLCAPRAAGGRDERRSFDDRAGAPALDLRPGGEECDRVERSHRRAARPRARGLRLGARDSLDPGRSRLRAPLHGAKPRRARPGSARPARRRARAARSADRDRAHRGRRRSRASPRGPRPRSLRDADLARARRAGGGPRRRRSAEGRRPGRAPLRAGAAAARGEIAGSAAALPARQSRLRPGGDRGAPPGSLSRGGLRRRRLHRSLESRQNARRRAIGASSSCARSPSSPTPCASGASCPTTGS